MVKGKKRVDRILFTILAAIVLMGIVVACLAIGRLITGKNRLRKGCGMVPHEKEGKTTSCSICGTEKICETEKQDKKKDATSNDHDGGETR